MRTKKFPIKPPKLRPKMSWQLEFSFRTAYTTACCYALAQVWTWGPLTMVSPAFSPMAASMYFGSWQITAWNVFYSTIVTSVLGTLVSFMWQFHTIQVYYTNAINSPFELYLRADSYDFLDNSLLK
jgi:hypothetical protein